MIRWFVQITSREDKQRIVPPQRLTEVGISNVNGTWNSSKAPHKKLDHDTKGAIRVMIHLLTATPCGAVQYKLLFSLYLIALQTTNASFQTVTAQNCQIAKMRTATKNKLSFSSSSSLSLHSPSSTPPPLSFTRSQ